MSAFTNKPLQMPMINNIRIDNNGLNYDPRANLSREIPDFTNFVQPREPSLNFGMASLPIPNQSGLSNQLSRSLDLLAQTDQLTISGYNKNSNMSEINDSNSNSNINVREVPQFGQFIESREPSLNFGMKALPVPNQTVLSNQLSNSLDLATEEAVSNYNKKSSMKLDTGFNEVSNILPGGIAKPFVPYPEYEKPTGFFDNFANKGRTDIVREYITHINSIDRDIIKYPNPFQYLVRCAPVSDSSQKDAYISRTFINIKYIKIEMAVLPRQYYMIQASAINDPIIIALFDTIPLPQSNTGVGTYKIIYSTNDTINYTTYNADLSVPVTVVYSATKDIITGLITTTSYTLSNVSLETDKYTIIYLNDINDVSNFSTDKTLMNAFNVFYPDAVSGNFLYVDTKYTDKVYKYSDLGNITRLNIRITNSLGRDLSVNVQSLDFNVPTLNNTTCTCTPETNTRDYSCICSYPRHPKFTSFQNNIMFKFGIVETDFDKRVFN